jgi:hypothetical protein
MSTSMKQFLKWLGRAIIAATGVILIISGVVTHSPKLVAMIVTGIAIIAVAVYATIRDLGGTTRADEETQAFLGVVELEKWYDWVVVLGLIAVCVVVWIVT